MNKRIFIIGSGAIGKALAVFLKKENKDVTLIRGSVDNQPEFKESITVILNGNTELQAGIEVCTLSDFNSLDGLIVLTNKSFGNKSLSDSLKNKTNRSPIIILQNGLGVENSFIENEYPVIYRCVLFATSQILPDSKVRFKPVSISPIGLINGNGFETLQSIVDTLNTTHFPFRSEKNIESFIWKKTVANCVFNSICPLLEIDNGIFHRNDLVLSLAKRVVKECVSIANDAGVQLNEAEVIDNILLISKLSDGQFISTLQDIRHKRKTEIETLNFEIARIARQFGNESLVTETKVLGELIKLKSELSRQQSITL